jgi:hypothetical protein
VEKYGRTLRAFWPVRDNTIRRLDITIAMEGNYPENGAGSATFRTAVGTTKHAVRERVRCGYLMLALHPRSLLRQDKLAAGEASSRPR